MRVELDNSTVMVTGASSGIGWEIARQLAPRVGTLILVARREERLKALAEDLTAVNAGLTVSVHPCDLTDRDEVDRMLQAAEGEVGPVHVLVNNAGMGDVSLFELSAWDKLERMLQINVTALTYLTHRIVGPMLERGKGGILNVSSGFGLTFMPAVAAYAATKHYVTAFTESLRIELAGTGVVVCQVCPGPVKTEFESVAGNPTGRSVPRWIEVSVERCSRLAIRGLERGRALTTPGFFLSALVMLGRITPRFLRRLLYRPVGGYLRRRHQRLGAG